MNDSYYTEYIKKYRKTPKGRATMLVCNYNRADKDANRGHGDLTAKWILENILFKPCSHCGKVGWDVIGCNRIDNTKPHTKDNVEPCCRNCNSTVYDKEVKPKRVDQIEKVTGEVVNQWLSSKDAAEKLGFSHGVINQCCRGGYFDKRRNKWVNTTQYNGYIWKRPIC